MKLLYETVRQKRKHAERCQMQHREKCYPSPSPRISLLRHLSEGLGVSETFEEKEKKKKRGIDKSSLVDVNKGGEHIAEPLAKCDVDIQG